MVSINLNPQNFITDNGWQKENWRKIRSAPTVKKSNCCPGNRTIARKMVNYRFIKIFYQLLHKRLIMFTIIF